jgi:hypothetical protein
MLARSDLLPNVRKEGLSSRLCSRFAAAVSCFATVPKLIERRVHYETA